MLSLETTHVDVPGGRLAVHLAGHGPLLVLLHGGALDHRMWEHQIASFAADHRVVAPDARGHGRSSTPDAPFRHCDDVAALVTALGRGPAILAGVSMGASTAVDTALEHPQLVRALVISGAGTSEPEWTDPWVHDIQATWARTQQAGDAAGWIEATMLFTAGPRRHLDEVDPEVVAACRRMITDTVRTHVRVDPATGDVRAPVLPGPVARTWERLPGITVPLLAVSGALDSPDHIAMAERVAREVPRGRAVTIGGAAHYPNMERPAQFDAAVRAFLRDERLG